MEALSTRLNFEPTANGQRLVLPRRRYGKGMLVVLFMTVFGVIFGGIPGYLLISAAREMFNTQEGGERFFAVLPVLFALPFMLIGLAVAAGPWLTLIAKTVIHLESGTIRVYEGIGPSGWSRSRPIEGITGFTVEIGSSRTNDGPKKPMKNFVSLMAEHDKKRNKKDAFVVAAGYPLAVMRDLAELLSDRLETRGRLGEERELAITEQMSSFRDEETIEEENGVEVVPDQPAKSDIRIEEHAQGVAYYLPARGVWKGSKGLLFFALIWNGFCLVFFGAMFMADEPPTWEGTDDPVSLWFTIPFVSLFVGVGLAMLLGAINSGKKKAILDISQRGGLPALLIAKESLFGRKTFDLPPGGVTGIAVTPSGVEVNDQPVMHLKIALTDNAAQSLARPKNPLGMFGERNDDELYWLAARLRCDLGVGMEIET